MNPQLKTTAGATDCHMHVYDDRYTAVPGAPFKPPHTPAAAYQAVQKELGLERVIVVQPAAYGFDNSCTLEAMAAFGPGSRGVAVIAPGTDDAEIERLTRAGVCGIRYFMLKGGLLPWDTLEPMAARLHEFGWHINLQLDGRDLPQYEAMLNRLPGRLVIDHNGKFLEPVATDHPGFRALLRLIEGGRTWVKLAAPYETSKSGPPGYEDVSVLARALVKAAPERCIWASNWPQPNFPSAPPSSAMLDMLLDWAPDEATRRRILVDNPAHLYGF
ncbi:MAG: amidohydrolase family protein [Betaproteobacteria bacterium]